MKALKIVAVLVLVYVAIVVGFESLIGALQPGDESTLVITTFASDGTAHERVVSRLESGGRLYVAANHWPRAWYRRMLANPQIQVTASGEKRDYLAVAVAGEEHERVDAEHRLPLAIRVLTGFPPRRFVRLDPREGPAS